MSMVYRGQVKGGVVVFEDAPPPEGTAVRVEAAADDCAPTLWQKLRKYSGVVKGLPPDMARNHDHYIHGAPRK